MGADLVMAYLVTDKEPTLNWDAVEPTLAAMSDEAVATAIEAIAGEPNETPEKDRQQVRNLFTGLRDLIEGDSDDLREYASFEVRGAWVHLAGGMSWGDSPSDAFNTINDAWWFPEILRAVGFDVSDNNG